mgnify:FL=1
MNENIFNWKTVLNQSSKFQNTKPFPYGYIKNVLNEELYKKLVETFPKEDEKWHRVKDWSRTASKRYFSNEQKNAHVIKGKNDSLSKEWNTFYEYLFSDDYIKNISEYIGIKLSGFKHFAFINNHKGDFNMPHYHFEDSQKGENAYKVTFLIYFSKGWSKGNGGTYVSENDDEDSIIFEPQDLDNSMMGFLETPISWHGSRVITKEQIRHSIQMTFF